MKKYIGIISGIMFVLSIGIAAAQITGGGLQVGTAANGQTIVSGNISGAIGSPTNGATAGVVGGVPAYSQGAAGVRQSTTVDLSFVTNLLGQLGGIISLLPKLLLGVAVVMFFWFLIKYFITDASDDKSKAVKNMGYSLAAIFVMVTLWGLIAFFGNALGINPNVQVNAPVLPR